jgi:hypothetical protein
MSNKLVPIKYTSRDFDSIKGDLVQLAKRYYPDSFKDFNDASFGSLMLDTVAYVGDILSFYVDYQANESFLETASEFNNIVKLGKQLGYKFDNTSTSTGIVTFYLGVPSNASSLGPDTKYIPTLKKGTALSSETGAKFILTEDVMFDSPFNEIRPLKVADNGAPISYAIKAKGHVISGLISSENINIVGFESFKKVQLTRKNIVEIISITDTEGNEYYEVDHLGQNLIYKSITNKDINENKLAKEILKPFLVPRRFVVEKDLDNTYIQFGGTSADVSVNDKNNLMAEPANTVLQFHGKDYISSDSFDPTRLLNNDKFGIAPASTTLVVTYRYQNTNSTVNFATNAVNRVDSGIYEFKDEENLIKEIVSNVKNSLEVTNEAPILGYTSVIDSDELKRRIQGNFASQNRAVTVADYKSLVYSMPFKFGSVKRVNVVRDDNSVKRNINMYVLCEDSSGYLTQPNQSVKRNLKIWLTKNKMINDSIDILNGKIVNYGIEFVAIGSSDRQKYDILSDAVSQIKKDFFLVYDFGQPISIIDIYSSLKKVNGLVDVVSVKLVPKVGDVYSDTNFSFDENMSSDKRYLNVPLNVVMELKYPKSDIKGTIL